MNRMLNLLFPSKELSETPESPPDYKLTFKCLACGEDEDYRLYLGVTNTPICKKCLKWIGENRLKSIKNK